MSESLQGRGRECTDAIVFTPDMLTALDKYEAEARSKAQGEQPDLGDEGNNDAPDDATMAPAGEKSTATPCLSCCDLFDVF